MVVLRQRLNDAIKALNAWESSEDARVMQARDQRSVA